MESWTAGLNCGAATLGGRDEDSQMTKYHLICTLFSIRFIDKKPLKLISEEKIQEIPEKAKRRSEIIT